MEFYITALGGMKRLFENIENTDAVNILNNCIEKYNLKKDIISFVKEFDKNGFFRNFELDISDFDSAEKFYWTQQLLGALISMALELSRAIDSGKSYTIDFIRRNFGHPTEIIDGTTCTNCGSNQINMADIDIYISSSIIAKRVVDGLENGSLNNNVDLIMSLSAPEISRERERTKSRIINSSIPFSQERIPRTVCLLCGCKDIKKRHFLKSLKKFVFVPLSI